MSPEQVKNLGKNGGAADSLLHLIVPKRQREGEAMRFYYLKKPEHPTFLTVPL